MIEKLTQDELSKFLSFGRRASAVLEILGKNLDFMTAIQTEVGQELLRDLIIKHDTLLAKISDLKATDEDKTQYKVVMELITDWSRKINGYNERIGEIKKSVASATRK